MTCLSPVTIRKQEKFVVLVAEDLGLQAWHAGSIDNSVVAESLTSVLIFMNKRCKFPGAGSKISAGRAA